MAIFNSHVNVYQRVYPSYILINPIESHWITIESPLNHHMGRVSHTFDATEGSNKNGYARCVDPIACQGRFLVKLTDEMWNQLKVGRVPLLAYVCCGKCRDSSNQLDQLDLFNGIFRRIFLWQKVDLSMKDWNVKHEPLEFDHQALDVINIHQISTMRNWDF